jgi:hypothetical protein
MYEPYSKTREWKEKSIDYLIDKLFNIAKVELWGLDSSEIKKSLSDLAIKPDYSEFIKRIYQYFKSEYPKNPPRIFGDKNPVYSELPASILNLIPDAKIVFIIRDPRDHVLSMRKANLGKNNTIRMAILWREAMRDMIRIKEQKPQNSFIIKYEEMVAEPEKIMTKCFDFLGIDYLPSVLEFYKQKDAYLNRFSPDRAERIHPNLFQPIKAGRSNRWKTEMDKTDLAIIDFIIEKYAIKLGYELSGYKLSYTQQAEIMIRLFLTRIMIMRRHQKIMSQLKSETE